MGDARSDPPTGPGARVATTAVTVAGAALGAAFAGVTAVRGARPLHPDGAVLRVELARHGSATATGCAWIDRPGVDTGRARLSRSIGLPAHLPDIQGLALTLDVPGGRADLLLATVGRGRVTRFVLTPHRAPSAGPWSSLFPYRAPSGLLLVGVLAAPRGLPSAPAELAASLAAEPWDVTLAHASLTGRWHPFARARIGGAVGPATDAPVRFDPVLHPLPGLAVPPALATLREPSYVSARRRPAR